MTRHSTKLLVSGLLHIFVALQFVCCASSLPSIPDDLTISSPAAPEVVGPKGKYSRAKARAILSREQQGAQADELISKTVSLMETLSGHPLTGGNRISLLIDGPATYTAMFNAIEAAKDHINFETYIFNDDDVGQRFADTLIRKQAEGVQVNLMYDSVGSIKTSPPFFDRLRTAGVNVLEFNPINPLKVRKKLMVARRDHRKVVVVDGKIAFTGGVNISSLYFGSSSSPVGQSEGSKDGWRDTHVQIEGPAAAELQRSFIEAWRHQNGPPLAARNYFPTLKAEGTMLCQVIPSYRGTANRLTYLMYLAVIKGANYSIDLTTPYFVPDHQMRKAIIEAAKRGVSVRLVLPGSSDSNLVFYAGRSFYQDLIEVGVKVYELKGRMLHSKTIVVDGIWSSVGSTNMDLLSFRYNNEINVIVVGKEFAEKMEGLFETDLAVSEEIAQDKWSARPISERFKEGFSKLLSPWL
jgi:cardiolipin synthase A/B